MSIKKIKYIGEDRMSRELLGFVFIALACIILTPFYSASEQPEKRIIKIEEPKIPESTMAQANSSKSIILLSDNFLPTTFAGSEISAYETIKYLRSRGHMISIYVNNWKVSEYDGFNIFKYNISDSFCKTQIKNADIIFFQMHDKIENLEEIINRKKPVYLFIHMVK